MQFDKLFAFHQTTWFTTLVGTFVAAWQLALTPFGAVFEFRLIATFNSHGMSAFRNFFLGLQQYKIQCIHESYRQLLAYMRKLQSIYIEEERSGNMTKKSPSPSGNRTRDLSLSTALSGLIARGYDTHRESERSPVRFPLRPEHFLIIFPLPPSCIRNSRSNLRYFHKANNLPSTFFCIFLGNQDKFFHMF